MLENLKINIDEIELLSLLTEYYKKLYNDDSVMIEYKSKFIYIDSYSSVEPNVWGVLSRKINGKIKEEVITLWNNDLSSEIFNAFKYDNLQYKLDIKCDMESPGKKDSERIVFNGIILNLNRKIKQKTL